MGMGMGMEMGSSKGLHKREHVSIDVIFVRNDIQFQVQVRCQYLTLWVFESPS